IPQSTRRSHVNQQRLDPPQFLLPRPLRQLASRGYRRCGHDDVCWRRPPRTQQPPPPETPLDAFERTCVAHHYHDHPWRQPVRLCGCRLVLLTLLCRDPQHNLDHGLDHIHSSARQPEHGRERRRDLLREIPVPGARDWRARVQDRGPDPGRRPERRHLVDGRDPGRNGAAAPR
ncbi:hypothetical protein BGZ52_013233, partial [Haplosporangium bisporale]